MKKEDYEAWIKTKSKAVQEVAKNLKPWECYRLRTKVGHYWLHAITENPNGAMTVKLINGKDSNLPGFMVMGVPLEELVLCGCGKFELSEGPNQIPINKN